MLNTKKNKLNQITKHINGYRNMGGNVGDISDGYHTFDELYYHRMILFLTIQKAYKDKAWKSKQHHDGTMFDDSFVVGIETPEGQYSYHYHLKYWDLFKDIPELDKAPKWDGHKPEDIDRLLSLFDYHRYRKDPVANPIANLMANPAATTKREPMVNINITGENRDINSITEDVKKSIEENFRNTMLNNFKID